MPNFKQDILEALATNADTVEDIEAVKILSLVDGTYDGKDIRAVGREDQVRLLLSWERVEKGFDYEYDSGYGGMDCDDILIWTRDNVYYVHEYDGSTSFRSIYRNPG